MKPFPTILTALILIITSFLLGKCSGSGDTDSGQPMSNHRIDSLNATIANLEANLQVKANEATTELTLIDSFKESGPKLVYKYIRAKDRRSEINSDSLNSIEIFDQLTTACDSLIANRDSTIAHHEIRDSALLQVISIQHDQLGLKDSVNNILADDLTKTTNRAKKAESKSKRRGKIAIVGWATAAIEAVIIWLK